jgi:chromosome segregation ATPase
VFSDGDTQKTLPAFVQRYPEEIKNIQDLQAAIKNRKFRLDEYNAQLDVLKKQLKDREEHYDAIKIALAKERAKTASDSTDLRKLEQEYFTAQRRLSDAQELNVQKAAEIGKLERQLKGRTQ